MTCHPYLDDFGHNLFSAWNFSSQSFSVVKILHRDLSLAFGFISELPEIKDRESEAKISPS